MNAAAWARRGRSAIAGSPARGRRRSHGSGAGSCMPTPTPVRGDRQRRCISTSTSASPLRGFVDRRRSPLICPRTAGPSTRPSSPASAVAATCSGSASRSRGSPSQLFITRLSGDGQRVIGPPTLLLTTQDAWESPLIENPAMIRYRVALLPLLLRWLLHRRLLRDRVRACRRHRAVHQGQQPAAAGDRRQGLGPGGAMPFVDHRGRLRLAYAAWDLGNTGYPVDHVVPSDRRRAVRSESCTWRRSGEGDGTLRVAARG